MNGGRCARGAALRRAAGEGHATARLLDSGRPPVPDAPPTARRKGSLAFESIQTHRYYPKLQCCVPFTPVTGPRLMAAPGPAPRRAAIIKALAETLVALTEALGASSLHVTFSEAEEWAAMGALGLQQRRCAHCGRMRGGRGRSRRSKAGLGIRLPRSVCAGPFRSGVNQSKAANAAHPP